MANSFMMLSREFFESEDYFLERFSKREAFLDLCYLAAYKDRTFKVRGIEVEQKAGQVAKSIRELAGRWHWSVNTVQRYLNELKSDGVIDTQKSTVIQVITIKKYLITNTQPDTQTDTQFDTQIDTPIIKNNKDNNKEKDSKESKKKKKELDLSIVAPEHVETVNLWLQYKKERGESYTPSGFVKMYSKLIRLSGNNPSKALKIIEQSMANNWSGFFDLKQDSLPIGFIQHDDGLEKYKNAETW